MDKPSFGSLTLRRKPKISDMEFKQLRDFIYKISGIYIQERRKYLIESRLGNRLNELGLEAFSEYLKILTSPTTRDKELDKLFEQITTNETSFFRDLKQLDAFRNFVLDYWLKKQEAANRKQINIWSAGCSSGEEPYTLAMMLHETLKMGIIGWRAKIIARDLSPAMIVKAKRGVYSEYAFKTTPEDMKKKYFLPDASGFKVHPKVQKLCDFGLINLNNDTAIKRIPPSQIIFCRNVIIYFDDEMKKRVLQSFYDNLVPGGFLVLGHSESIHKYNTPFKPIIKIGGVFYQKPE